MPLGSRKTNFVDEDSPLLGFALLTRHRFESCLTRGANAVKILYEQIVASSDAFNRLTQIPKL